MGIARKDGETSTEGFWTHQRELREAGRQLGRVARATADDVAVVCRRQLERNPYVMLGAVFSVGYVLGGGVPVRAVRFALALGLRVGATVAVRELAARARPTFASKPTAESRGLKEARA